MNNDMNPPPAETREVESRKRKKNPLEKRTGPPLNEFKRVVRPQTSLAASAAVDHARAESPLSLETDTPEFGKVHDTIATPDFRPNKLHGVLDSAYKHSRLRWLDYFENVSLRGIVLGVLTVGIVVFTGWKYFGSLGTDVAVAPSDQPVVKGISAEERVARGKKAVEEFIKAQTNEARLPYVMDPDRARPRMEQFYGAMGGQNPNVVSWEVGAPVGSKNGDWLPFTFTDTTGRKVTVAMGENATGCLIDWENFVAFGEMQWKEFCRTKPSQPQSMRVRVRKTERYGGSFTKEGWQSYEVEHRSGAPALVGFVNRKERFAQELDELVTGERWQCALVYLRFDPAAPEGVVLIDGIVRARWQDEATSWTGP